MKVGAILSSFKMDTKSSLEKAAEIGVDGVQLWNVKNDLDPENMSSAQRKDFVKLVKSLGLSISALCGDGYSYSDDSKMDWAIKRSKQLLELSIDLESPIVTTHIGIIPEDETSKGWDTMLKAMNVLGKYAEKLGSCLATETGPESPGLMLKFFNKLDNRGIKVNYDPANLVMKNYDHIKGVEELKDYIVHTHAKDGKRNNGEMPLGEGDVNFPEYLTALKKINYDGFLTIEREVGENPVADITKAKQFLKNLGI